MRNFLALIGLLVLVFVAVGWWRGWYEVEHSASTEGTADLKLNLDLKKSGTDVKTAIKEGGEFLQELSESREKGEGTATEAHESEAVPVTPKVQPRNGPPPPASLPGPARRQAPTNDPIWWQPPPN